MTLLTGRERQIANAVYLGHRQAFIAAQLGLSPETIRVHITNIFDKTGFSRCFDLTMFLHFNPRYLDTTAVRGGGTCTSALF